MNEQQEAAQRVAACAWIGVIAIVGGVILAALQMPKSEATFNGVDETGDPTAFFFGLMISGAGSLLLTVALVAYGVSLGMKMSRASVDKGSA